MTLLGDQKGKKVKNKAKNGKKGDTFKAFLAQRPTFLTKQEKITLYSVHNSL